MDSYLITCIVQRGKADGIVKEALKSKATGATMFFARGTGVRQKLGLLGAFIQPEKEVIFIVVKEESRNEMFDLVAKAARLDKPGYGIAYMHKLDRVEGLVPHDKGPK